MVPDVLLDLETPRWNIALQPPSLQRNWWRNWWRTLKSCLLCCPSGAIGVPHGAVGVPHGAVGGLAVALAVALANNCQPGRDEGLSGIGGEPLTYKRPVVVNMRFPSGCWWWAGVLAVATEGMREVLCFRSVWWLLAEWR